MSSVRVRATQCYGDHNDQADSQLCVPEPEERASEMTSGNAKSDGPIDDGIPIDRGWAWVVVFAGFMNSALLNGYYKSSGIFFVELLDYYKSTNSHTALLFAIKGALYSIGGLFVMNVVVGRLGCRKTILIGAACLSLSAILASIANQLTLLIFTQAALLGLAHVMVIHPAEVLVAAYFRDRRYLALAIFKCGSSVGAMTLPPLVTYLLSQWGLKGAYLLTGGVLLHAFPSALLFRPTSYFSLSKRRSVQTPQDSQAVDEGKTLLGRRGEENNISIGPPSPRDQNTGKTAKTILSHFDVEPRETPRSEHELSRSMRNIAATLEAKLDKGFTPEGCAGAGNTDRSGNRHRAARNGRDRFGYHGENCDNWSENDRDSFEFDRENSEKIGENFNKRHGNNEEGRLAAVYTSVGENNGVQDMSSVSKQSKESPTYFTHDKTTTPLSTFLSNGQRLSTQNSARHTAESEEDSLSETTRSQSESASCARSVVSCLKAFVFVLDFSLFRRPKFRVLFLCFVLFPNAWMGTDYLPALARQNGVSETDVAFLLTIVGALDLVSRLTSGLIANLQVVKVPVLIAASFALLGSVHQCVRLMTSFPALLALAVVQGLLGSVVNCLLPMLIVDTVGVKDMAKGIGFYQLAAGTFQAAVHPLLGHIRDVTGSYVIVYHMIGGCVLLAAVLLCIMGPVTHKDSRSNTETELTIEKV